MASVFTPGASSMIFWCLLCTLQSRSNRYTALPCWSPNTCTSTCLNNHTHIRQMSFHTDKSCWNIWNANILSSLENSQKGKSRGYVLYSVGLVTWGCPQTSPPAWHHRWMIWELLFWRTPAAREILLLSEQYAFPVQYNTLKPIKLNIKTNLV